MKRIEKKKIVVSVDARILDLASDILHDLGCPLNEAINIFLYHLFYTRSIPFPIKLTAESEWAKFDLWLKISDGLQDMENGRVVSGEQAIKKLKQKLDEAMLKSNPSKTTER